VQGATDVCPNIAGDQATVPTGMTKDQTTGNCVTTVINGGQGGGGEVLGASTTAPQLANTGQSPWAAVIVGLTVISLTLTSAFASRRLNLDA
jgi:LPXTG-motif cell wall-anchored protein